MLEETHDKAQVQTLINSISGPNADIHSIAMVVRTILEAIKRKAKEPPPPPKVEEAKPAQAAGAHAKDEEDDDDGPQKTQARPAQRTSR